MLRNLCLTVLLWIITKCLSQVPRPTFPDTFQTEIEGTFIEENRVVEIDATMYFDRRNNRAALTVIKEGELNTLVYNFDTDENLSIDNNECEVQEIPEITGFFPYTTENGAKKMSSAEEAFCFTESELEPPISGDDILPINKYRAINVNLKQFAASNCNLTHIFSKTDVELPSCKEGVYCNSTLITLAVQCMNEEGGIELDHLYRFSKFVFEIQDKSVFLPPPGVHCDMKNTKEIPRFPPYFSFTFDIIERKEYFEGIAAFNTHKKIWYDSEYSIIRIDEFDYSGLLYSSRMFDIEAGVAFTIVATVPTCEINSVDRSIKLDEITRLPKSFFFQNVTKNNSTANETNPDQHDSEDGNEVYVGKRKVHGMDYDVWSRLWSDSKSDARVVEEVYFLQILSNKEIFSEEDRKETYYQISHVDMYTYEMNDNSYEYELELLKYFSINNFRNSPKEWAAFDVSACFNNNQIKVFSMKIKGTPFVRESQSYRELLELLYNRIIDATGVSVVRISKLRGIFDGIKLVEIRGSILDNSQISGWPKKTRGPGVDETFKLIKKAASENRLSVSLVGEDNKKITVNITSVEEIKSSSGSKKKCFSGASLAAASLVLLLLGMVFGVAGYYVFLKKRKRTTHVHVRMSEIDEK